MKTFLTLLFCSFIFIVNAQAPQKISYQGIARSTSGSVLANQAVGVQFQIHQGSAAGTIVFTETHNATTNSFGLFNLSIGSNNVAGFNAIDWSQSPYFIEVSIDPTGGTAYVSVGTSELISVPYALYAEKAGNATPVPTISINSPNTVSNPSTGIYNISVPSQTLDLVGNSLSISNGNSVTLPAGVTYTAGNGIDLTGNIITNTAPDQTITISGTGVTGVYPNFTITPVSSPSTTLVQGTNVLLNQAGNTYTVSSVTPTLTVAGNNISINPGNTQALPIYSLTQSGSNIDLTQNGAAIATVTLTASTSTSLTAGNSNITLNQSGNNYTLTPVTPTLNVVGGTLSGAYPTQTLTIPTSSTTALTQSTNISISGVAPNYTISSPSQSLSVSGNSLSISGANTVTIPATTVTGSSNVTVTGTSPSFTVSAPNYVLGASSNSITLTNGVNSSSVAVPVQSLSLVGTTLTAGPTTNSVNLSALPGNWTVSSGVIYPTTVTNSVGIGTSGPITDKMEINHASTPTNTHLHLKQTGADAFSRIKFSNAVAPTKYWINSVTSAATDNNSGFNIYYNNGTVGRNLFTVAGDGKVSVNPFSLAYPTLFEVNGHVELDSTLSVNGLAAMPPASLINAGRIYYDRATQRFMVSENAGAYKPLFGAGPWTQSVGSVTLTNIGDRVGIGVFNPTAKLDVVESISGTSGTAINVAVTSSATGGPNSGIYSNVDGSSTGNYISGYFRSAGLAGASGNYTGAKGLAVGNSGSSGLAVGLDGNGQGSNQNYGVSAIAMGNIGVTNYGVYSEASGVGSNYALFAVANGTVGSNYAAYLRGHTYTEGKFALGAITNTPTAFINQGTFYYDSGLGKIMVSENGAAYKPLFGVGPWVQSVGSVTLSNIGDKVGIGTSSPQSKLHVIESATVSAINVNNSGSGEAINAIGGTGRSIYASTNSSTWATIETTNQNAGYALSASKSTAAGGVVVISNSSTANGSEALFVSNVGSGAAIRAAAGTGTVSALSLHLDNGHIKTTSSTAPIIGSGGTNITGPTITRTLAAGVNSNDVSGSVSVNFSPATNIGTGQYVEFRITFQKPYSIKPKVIAICQTYPFVVYVSTTSTTDCQIVIQNVGATINSISTITVNYMIME